MILAIIIIGIVTEVIGWIKDFNLNEHWKKIIRITGLIVIIAGGTLKFYENKATSPEPKLVIQNNPILRIHDTIKEKYSLQKFIEPKISLVSGNFKNSDVVRINDSVAKIPFTFMVLNEGVIDSTKFRCVADILKNNNFINVKYSKHDFMDKTAVGKMSPISMFPNFNFKKTDSLFIRIYCYYAIGRKIKVQRYDFFVYQDSFEGAIGTIKKDTLDKYLKL